MILGFGISIMVMTLGSPEQYGFEMIVLLLHRMNTVCIDAKTVKYTKPT